MSVLHIAMFKWGEQVTETQVGDFTAALETLKTQMPILKSFRFGRDLGLRDGNYDYGVVAELAQPSQVAEYLDHELHQQLIKAHVQHMLGERKAVQILNFGD